MKKKKKVVGIVSIVVGSITFGHLFSLSLLAGFLAGKFGGGKSAGERGRIISIAIPLVNGDSIFITGFAPYGQ